jgi:uncharacterized glyoxalase superfamily protein PhnB
MARVSTYLNFPRTTEEAFAFYRSVFGTEFLGPIARFGDMPGVPDQRRPTNGWSCTSNCRSWPDTS